MNKSKIVSLLSGAALILPLGALNAQFSFDFTGEEGFSDGPIVSYQPSDFTDNGEWPTDEPWPTWSDPIENSLTTFQVETSGTGALVIDPDAGGWHDVKYNGDGGVLFLNNPIYVETHFSINYTEGAGNALVTGATPLPQFLIRSWDDQSKTFEFNMRHAPWDGVSNLFNANTKAIDGSQDWLPGFSGTQIGLDITDAGEVIDGQSDNLMISFSLVPQGGGDYEISYLLMNKDTSEELINKTRVANDPDGLWELSTGFLAIAKAQMDSEEVAVHIDRLTLSYEPIIGEATWAGYPVDEKGWVDTEDWMGWLNGTHAPWIWSESMNGYIYLPEENVSDIGAWLYAPGS